jgi:hypothetical protein
MNELFRLLSYWRQKHKIKTIWDALRKVLGGALYHGAGFVDIMERLKRLEEGINVLEIRLKQYIPGDRDNRYRYYLDYKVTDEEEEEVLLPDLFIKDLLIDPKDHYASIEITVKNIGEEVAGGSSLKVSIAGEEDYDTILSIPALDIDSEATLYASFPYDESGSSKSYSVTAEADVNNIVEESDETNNTATRNFTAKTTHIESNPPPSGQGYLFYHIHNPEGVEINSITGVWAHGGAWRATLYYQRQPEGSPFGTVYGAHNEATHVHPSGGSMLQLPAGNYHCTASFNGMSVFKIVTVPDGGSVTEIFTFSRTEITDQISDYYTYNHDHTFTSTGRLSDYYSNSVPSAMGVFDSLHYGTWTTWTSIGHVVQTITPSVRSAYIEGEVTYSPDGAGSGHTDCQLHHYPWMGATYIIWYLPVNIPAQTFQDWIWQHGNSSDYITIKPGSFILCHEDYTGYYIQGQSASNLITGLKVVSGGGLGVRAQPNGGKVSQASVGYMEDLHVSSVPYDLDGLGVKG